MAHELKNPTDTPKSKPSTADKESNQVDDKGDEGVTIPEDFQKEVHGVISKASTKHHVAHIRSKLNEKEDEMRKAEDEEMNMEGAPASLKG